MRISIREQLSLLILLSSLVGVGVISIATWVSNREFVLEICKNRLSLAASLKSAQLASNLALMRTAVELVSTRTLTQAALDRYNAQSNNSAGNWAAAQDGMQVAIGGGGAGGQSLILQIIAYPKNDTGPEGFRGLMNTTSTAILDAIRLPYDCPNGAPAFLGSSDCGGLGYPPQLYPNLTFFTTEYNETFNTQQADYHGRIIGPQAQPALLLGPLQVNETFSLASLTVPVVSNSSSVDVLGWLTAVMNASLIYSISNSTEGLGKTGQALVVGPLDQSNVFPNGTTYRTNEDNPQGNFEVRHVVPPKSTTPRNLNDASKVFFEVDDYSAVKQAITERTNEINNAGAVVQTRNEANKRVAVGYATAPTDLVDWVVIVEQSRGEVWRPIVRLRNIILACLFATIVFMAIIAFPLAHFASLPIRRLREATLKTIEPSELSRSTRGSEDSNHERPTDGPADTELAPSGEQVIVSEKGSKTFSVAAWREKRKQQRQARRDERRRKSYRVPGKVKERKTLVKDELSDLTRTFNEMSDELMMQYERLEERVRSRTADLELSKKAAEAANESKTLFIANISHELKTPLNGVLGMAALAMQEDDPVRQKRYLGIIYKSGDLLLHLLTDLLTFSKNQVGQHLTLDEKEFRLRDVSSQVLAIFDKQAKEGNIGFRVQWEGMQNLCNDDASPERTEFGPQGTGRLKDMVLWGSLERILQVVINLVGNAAKFTPPGGSVVLTIRCLAETPEPAHRAGSTTSKQSRQSRPQSSRHRNSDSAMSTSLTINPRGNPSTSAVGTANEAAKAPPPGKNLFFEFEVTDTGPGIPQNLQQKIFEPFVQGDLGLSKKFGGTGLGLSICLQLATIMGGSINVQSTVEVGSTFTMKVPLRHLKTRADSQASSRFGLNQESGPSTSRDDLALQRSGRSTPFEGSEDSANRGKAPQARLQTPDGPPTPSNDSQPRLIGLSQPFFSSSQPMESPGSQSAAMEKITADAARSSGKIRVLVAEDNKVNQEVVLRMLKLEDVYDVTVAKDGQEALDLVKQSMTPGQGGDPQPFNLISMDVQMPNVDGLQSTRLIREFGYQAPIVALTAFAEESNIRDCLDSGMNHFLAKPIRRPQLKKVLKEYCAPIPEEGEEKDASSPNPQKRSPRISSNTTTQIQQPKPGVPSVFVAPPGAEQGRDHDMFTFKQRPFDGSLRQGKDGKAGQGEGDGDRPVTPGSPVSPMSTPPLEKRESG